MGHRVVEKVDHGRGVDVGEAVEAAGEVGRVVVGAEDRAELRVENVLRHNPVRKKRNEIVISTTMIG